jgi:hypothetical protein
VPEVSGWEAPQSWVSATVCLAGYCQHSRGMASKLSDQNSGSSHQMLYTSAVTWVQMLPCQLLGGYGSSPLTPGSGPASASVAHALTHSPTYLSFSNMLSLTPRARLDGFMGIPCKAGKQQRPRGC